MASREGDPIEVLFARGVTDGLPAVPPTAARVAAAVAAAGRAPDELVAEMPPRFGRATVEKIAINAVMAGCLPEYLPVVLAAVEAICDERFCLLGVSGTTDAVAPLVIVNGPIRKALDINAGAGVFGPGWRANATIGRAVRLCWVNIGGAQPGVISMSTFGGPGRYTYCIGEHEEASPWEPLHVEHGFDVRESTVGVLAAEAPQIVADTRSRSAPDLLGTIVRSVEVVAHHKAVELGDTALVFSPEHVKTLAADGWSKSRVRAFLWERLQKPVRDSSRDGTEARGSRTRRWPRSLKGPGARRGCRSSRPRRASSCWWRAERQDASPRSFRAGHSETPRRASSSGRSPRRHKRRGPLR